jgi:hypothetical protein
MRVLHATGDDFGFGPIIFAPPNGLLNFEPRLPFGDFVKGFRLH